MSKPESPAVYTAIFNVMNELDAISKGRRNQQQGYAFRGIEDIYNSLHPLCAKHELVTFPRVISRDEQIYENKNGTRMIRVVMAIEYNFVGRDGSVHTCGPIYSEAMDSSDKASNKALSVAHKYAMIQTFMIPTEDLDDSDRETPIFNKDLQPQPKERGPKPITPALPEKVEKKIEAKKELQNRAAHIGAMKKGKWTLEQAKLWVQEFYGVDSTTKLNEDQYRELCETFASFSFEQAKQALGGSK